MKRLLVIGIFLLFLFCNISFTTMSDENSGNLSGKTLYVGGSGEGNYTRIQNAIDNASDGDTVFVYKGNYYEEIIINKSIRLIGEDNRYSVIKVNNSQFIFVFADNIEITNFKIEGLSDSYAFQIINSSYCRLHHNLFHTEYAIYVENCNHITLDNNTIIETVFIAFGIIVFYSDHTLIENNTFDYDNGDWESGGTGGIYLHDSPYGKIINNYIYNIPQPDSWFIQRQMDGIYLWKSPHCIVADNFIDQGTTGMSIWWYSSDSIITDNYVSNALKWGIGIDNNPNSTFLENTLLFCGDGFSIYHSSDNLFSGNRISFNGCGFDIGFSENNSIIKNKISGNVCGIDITSSNDNKIWKNNIISNVIDATILKTSIYDCENDWDNNYWNRPRIMPRIITCSLYDFIRDHKIYFDVDWHPALLPYDIQVPEV